MANNLYTLIEKLSSRNQLKIFENSYIKKVDSAYYDISSEIIIQNNKYFGRGIDTDPDIAVKKSIFESIERSLINFNNLENSNGVALSDIKHMAAESAKNELLERHLFLYHWHNQETFIHFENSLTTQLKKKFYLSFPSDIKIQFFQTLTWQESNCYLCLLTGADYHQSFGCILGMGFNIQSDKSVLHSFFEAISSLSHELNTGSILENHTLEQFNSIQNPDFKDHGKLAKNLDYFKKFQHLFPENKNSKITKAILSSNNFYYKELKIPVACDIYAVKCSHDALFDLYTGYSSLTEKNNFPHFLD